MKLHITDKQRDAMSVKILSTVETSCTTNPQHIEIMESEGYSWPTCSKQPRLVDCHTGVVNKLDRRRRQRRVLLTTRSTCGEIFQVRGKVPEESTLFFWRYPNFLITHYGIGGRKPPCQKPARFVQSFRYNTGLWRTNGRKRHMTTAYTQGDSDVILFHIYAGWLLPPSCR